MRLRGHRSLRSGLLRVERPRLRWSSVSGQTLSDNQGLCPFFSAVFPPAILGFEARPGQSSNAHWWQMRLSSVNTDQDLDGLPPGEGAFLFCSFWLVDNYVMQGCYEEAQQLFDRL